MTGIVVIPAKRSAERESSRKRRRAESGWIPADALRACGNDDGGDVEAIADGCLSPPHDARGCPRHQGRGGRDGAGGRHRRLSGEGCARGLGRHASARCARHLRRAGTARHFRGRRRLAHRRAHHLDRHHPRRAAAAVRWAEARRARGRRGADPEPRHARRQHLHGLAGGGRCAQPAGARCERGACESCRAAASCPCAASSTAIVTPSARHDELVTAILVPRPKRRWRAAISSSSARASISSSPSPWWPASSRSMRRASSPPPASPSARARPSRSACRRSRQRSLGSRRRLRRTSFL